MPEIGTSGSMSGDGKRAIGKASSTAPILDSTRIAPSPGSAGLGRVSRASPVHTAVRNCTRDEGGPFGFGDQVLIPSHRELLRSKAVVVSVAETPER